MLKRRSVLSLAFSIPLLIRDCMLTSPKGADAFDPKQLLPLVFSMTRGHYVSPANTGPGINCSISVVPLTIYGVDPRRRAYNFQYTIIVHLRCLCVPRAPVGPTAVINVCVINGGFPGIEKLPNLFMRGFRGFARRIQP